ncbi:MAG: hypothetical protein RIT04_582 [Candidatus Parcubacteria bacterium]
MNTNHPYILALLTIFVASISLRITVLSPYSASGLLYANSEQRILGWILSSIVRFVISTIFLFICVLVTPLTFEMFSVPHHSIFGFCFYSALLINALASRFGAEWDAEEDCECDSISGDLYRPPSNHQIDEYLGFMPHVGFAVAAFGLIIQFFQILPPLSKLS